MSLINDMLKELEHRAKNTNEPSHSIQGLQAHANFILRKNKKFHSLLIGFLGCILLLLTLALWHKHSLKMSAQTKLSLNAQVNHANLNNANESDSFTLQDASSHLLTGVALQVQLDMSSLRFLLSQATLYRLNFNVARNELEIVLDHTSLLAALPKINFVNSGIEKIQAFNDEQGNLKLVLSLSPTTEIKSLELSDQGKSPELILELALKPVSTASTIQSKNTIPVTVNNPIVENKTEQEFQSALKLSSAGNDAQAIQLLTALINEYPSYNQGREFLIRLLVRQGNHKEASQILNEGLELQPTSSVYSELKARLLLEDGKLDQAVKLLEKNAPPLASNTEYHAFIAALYQRQGKTSLAANVYKQLLSLEPENAKWWLGLGLALDAMGHREQATEAYVNADSIGNLSPELKAYIETQLHNV